MRFDKAEDYPPIGSHCDRPETLRLAFERMKPKTRHIHIGNRSSGIKSRQNVSQLHRMFSHHATRVVFLVEAL